MINKNGAAAAHMCAKHSMRCGGTCPSCAVRLRRLLQTADRGLLHGLHRGIAAAGERAFLNGWRPPACHAYPATITHTHTTPPPHTHITPHHHTTTRTPHCHHTHARARTHTRRHHPNTRRRACPSLSGGTPCGPCLCTSFDVSPAACPPGAGSVRRSRGARLATHRPQ